jgi:hypothetical protein
VVVQEKHVTVPIGMALGLTMQMVYTVSHFSFAPGLLRAPLDRRVFEGFS